MNKIKVGAKIKVNAENPTTAHTLARCSAFKETTWTQRTSLKNFS